MENSSCTPCSNPPTESPLPTEQSPWPSPQDPAQHSPEPPSASSHTTVTQLTPWPSLTYLLFPNTHCVHPDLAHGYPLFLCLNQTSPQVTMAEPLSLL